MKKTEQNNKNAPKLSENSIEYAFLNGKSSGECAWNANYPNPYLLTTPFQQPKTNRKCLFLNLVVKISYIDLAQTDPIGLYLLKGQA